MSPYPARNQKLRFFEKVKVSGINDCWEWIAAKIEKRYGYFLFNKKMEYAHRSSWIMFNGEIPNGLAVCHSCDNPGCVNPNHLWLGTAADNQIDKTKKGRHHETQKTHCKWGHEFTEENTYFRKSKTIGFKNRGCKLCKLKRDTLFYFKKKELI